jgi:hypothetical protein
MFKEKNIMNKACFIAVIFALPLFVSTGFANAAKDSSAADIILTKILNAVENNDLNSFVANGNDQFKAAITKKIFETVSGKYAPRMKKGYEVTQVGTLNQQGCKIYLEKIVFKDGGDDVLARLLLRDGKVVGFWFQ